MSNLNNLVSQISVLTGIPFNTLDKVATTNGITFIIEHPEAITCTIQQKLKLKQLKGYVDEVVLHMNRNQSNNEAIKDIVNVANEELKVPKKIVKRMAKTQFKQSFQTEIAEDKEFEALFESMIEVR